MQTGSSDDGAGILFGRLDSELLLDATLHVGEEPAAGYNKVVKH